MLNRSIICKVANQLHKSGYTLSQSFRLAWRLAKGKASVKVAGVTKGNRQQAIEHLKRYSLDMVSFILKREPNNIYDSNAISVYAKVGNSKMYKMGYISAVVSNLLCGVIDNIISIKATLQAITGGFYVDMVQGIRLHLSTEE
ncbi:HIRAN domain-containing protein [Ruminococcus sp. LCP21S3_E8]|nr:HIRAN domain-containing protein [uncultured Ruminococcus sp.]